ncbi:helix-turn-helix transcriptional regulator, partial [Citrobacter freundii]
CGKKIGPDPRNFNQRVSLGRNDLLIRTFPYSSRVIWPIGLVYMESCWLLVAWCEMRNDFRHFRTDKIKEIEQLDSFYSESRAVLLKKWRVKEGISEEKEY